jgi:hypothetical protein
MTKKLPRGARSQAVRDFVAKNPTATVKEVVDGVAKTGIKVSVGLVNVLKYKKARKKRVIKDASSHGIDIKQLIAVKKLIDELGGMEQMRFAMMALEQLQ